MSKLYTPSDLAGWTNLTRQGVAKAFKNPPLSAAKVGKLIDIEHPVASEWLRGRKVDPVEVNHVTGLLGVAESCSEFPNSETTPAPRVAVDQTQRPGDILNLTLLQITDRFGTAPEFVDWLKARKELAMVQMREAQLDELQGRLIEREFVEQFVFGYLDELSKRLLTDTAKTLSRKAWHEGAAKMPVAETEAAAVKMISEQLQATKMRISRKLQEKAKANEEPSDV